MSEQKDSDLSHASTSGLSHGDATALIAGIDALYAKATTDDGEWLLWQSRPPRSFEIGPSCRQITALMTNDSTEDNEFGENNGLLINALVNAWPKLRALASVSGTPQDIAPPNPKPAIAAPAQQEEPAICHECGNGNRLNGRILHAVTCSRGNRGAQQEEGYVRVPVEPTPQMIGAAWSSFNAAPDPGKFDPARHYRCMLAAAQPDSKPE